MLIQGIPSKQIVCTAARINKDYEIDFVNTDTNSDVYTLKTFLRKGEDQYKVRLMLISSILAYPAFEMVWVYEEEEYDLASRVYHRICDEIDDVKTHYDRSMTPAPIIAAQIREAVKPISVSHQEKTNILALDEAALLSGTSDWRMSIYRGQYPNMTKAEKDRIRKFDGNYTEQPVQSKSYSTREKY